MLYVTNQSFFSLTSNTHTVVFTKHAAIFPVVESHASAYTGDPVPCCATTCPSLTSHTTTVESNDPDASIMPSAENATEYTWVVCSLNTDTPTPRSTSHNRTHASNDALASCTRASTAPAGIHVTLYTSRVWPLRVWRSVSPDHIHTWASSDPLASKRPSLLHRTQLTPRV